jgi:CubicO group peptidase (beta-lactamase class C family)/lipoprotein-anchoring transpeptidase ErfK/SrfK
MGTVSDPYVDVNVFITAVEQRIKGSVVGYSGCIGTATASVQTFSGGQARTSADGTAIGVQTSTSFGIASVSKFLTALAAVRLLDGAMPGDVYGQNVLGASLDSEIFLALPKGWTVQDEAVKQITYRQLLTHTSGLAPEGSPGEPASDYASLEAYITAPHVNLVHLGPGQTAYSNVGFALFRLLLPTLNGMTDDPTLPQDNRAAAFATAYEQIVVQQVFAPVGVTGPTSGTPAVDDYVFAYAYPGTTPGFDWNTWRYAGQTWPGQGEPLCAGAATWWVSIAEFSPVLNSLNKVDGRLLSTTQWLHMQGLDTSPGFENLGLGLDVLVDQANPGATGYRYVEKNGGLTSNNDTILSSSVAFFGSGPNYAALFLNSDLSPGPGGQTNWHYCSKCQALFYDLNSAGVCPAGGSHSAGGEYIISTDAQESGQSGWKCCSQCQTLCFEPAPQGYPSVCPVGGSRHICPEASFILSEATPTLEVQDGWKWCRKCGVLAYSENGPGVCAAKNGHDFTQSGNYTLRTVVGADCVLLEAFREAIQQNGGVGFFAQGTPVASVVNRAAGIHLFAVGENGEVFTAVNGGSSWQPWSSVLNGTFTQGTPVAAVADAAGAIHLFAVGENGEVFTAVNGGSSWQVWSSVLNGVFTQGTPVAAVSASGAIHLFAVGENDKVFTAVNGGSGWQGWSSVLNGTFTQRTPVAAVADASGAIHLFAVGENGEVFTAVNGGSGWQGWSSVLNGVFTQGTPVAAVSAAGAIHLVAVGENGEVFTAVNGGSGWQGWNPIPNGTFSQGTPVAAVISGADIHLFALGENKNVFTAVYNGSNWQGWSPVPTGIFTQGTPVAAVAIGATDIHLFAVEEIGNVFTAVYNGSSWQEWSPVGT